MSVLPSPDEKSAYVEQMFSRIADGYDTMNRIMTFGLDQGWRNYAADSIGLASNGRVLDLGCGTGDFLPILAQRAYDGMVVGADYTLPMMQEGLGKLAKLGGRGSFIQGDALRLPFADGAFDAVTTGFMMRNVTDIGAAFREIARVTRPGGRVACLEVARPKNPLVRLGHGIYFYRMVPLIARALGADPTAYRYLPQSAQAFPQPARLAEIMADAGWGDVRYTLLGFGAVAVHIGVKQ